MLTKPIGLGVLATALKRDAASARNVADAIEVMTTLNASARDAALAVGVHAATDVTGFGLLGHMLEMVRASGLGAEIDADAVPIIDGVRDLVAAGMVAGGTQRNHAFVSEGVDWGELPLDGQYLLADAQTSGGLLLSVAADRGRRARRASSGNATRSPPRSSVTPRPRTRARFMFGNTGRVLAARQRTEPGVSPRR